MVIKTLVLLITTDIKVYQIQNTENYGHHNAKLTTSYENLVLQIREKRENDDDENRTMRSVGQFW